jgi:hypothetical protein
MQNHILNTKHLSASISVHQWFLVLGIWDQRIGSFSKSPGLTQPARGLSPRMKRS